MPSTIYRTVKYDAAGRTAETYDPLVHTCCENNHTYTDTYDANGWRTKEYVLSQPPKMSDRMDKKFRCDDDG